ncbi:MAG: acyl carrier protein [Acidobacteria bacterium]|nr:MAG: acyl carrier protein [Acidobacteriota bacterium]
MTEAEILTGLTQIVQETLGDDAITLTLETTAEDVQRWDSFNHINILVAAEVRFGVKFQTAEIEELRDVGQLVRLISKKAHGSPAR